MANNIINTGLNLMNTAYNGAGGIVLSGDAVKGGYFVTDTLNNIPSWSNTTGTLCYCQEDSKFYQYDGTNWIEAALGGKVDKLIIGDGEANGLHSIAGGSTNSSIVDNYVGTGIASSAINLSASDAKGNMSIALGAGIQDVKVLGVTLMPGQKNIAYSDASIALGLGNISGGKGYYVSAINTTDKTLTLSTTQKSATAPTTAPSWKAGDRLFFENDDRYFLEVAADTTNSIVNVKELPFDSLASFSTYTKPTERAIINVTQPESGEVTLGFGAIGIGAQNISVGSGAYAVGYKNVVAGAYGAAFGQENQVGYSAFATGIGNKALGKTSYVSGEGNEASGRATHATGKGTTASGDYAQSSGYETISSGWASHTEGHTTKATKSSAHAEGIYAIASGDGSHAEGDDTRAEGYASHAEGYKTIANADYSHTEGRSTKAYGRYSHAEGDNTYADGKASHAQGSYSKALGDYSDARGQKTTALGKCSSSAGDSSYSFTNAGVNSDSLDGEILTAWETKKFSLAKGKASHVDGKDCLAIGDYSTAWGYSTIAQGWASTALGQYTEARGSMSFAGGNYSEAAYEGSFVYGNKLKASRKYQAVFGDNNIDNSNALLIVGANNNVHDTSVVRNAFEVLDNGEVRAGTAMLMTRHQFAIGHNNMGVVNLNSFHLITPTCSYIYVLLLMPNVVDSNSSVVEGPVMSVVELRVNDSRLSCSGVISYCPLTYRDDPSLIRIEDIRVEFTRSSTSSDSYSLTLFNNNTNAQLSFPNYVTAIVLNRR